MEYSITKKGQSLENILDLMCDWGEQNMDERFELIANALRVSPTQLLIEQLTCTEIYASIE